MEQLILRAHMEDAYAAELAELAAADSRPRPVNWRLSPWAVATYILGGTLDNGFEVTPKYIGNGRLIEIAIATLTTDRALLLMGIPGTGKTWVSEHLAAAISGDSTLLVQGTAGTGEEAIRYGWNYASLIAHGPTPDALVPSPMMMAMQRRQNGPRRRADAHPGRRAGRADHHSLRKAAAYSGTEPAKCRRCKGFNVIATANDRDRGVNDLSSASSAASTRSCCRCRPPPKRK